MSKIDLHIHSDISIDGEHSPEKIVKACMDLEMVMIAVTDHNSVRGIGEALKAAKAKIRLFVKTTGIPVAEEEIMAASVNGIVTGEQIAEHVLEREDAGEKDDRLTAGIRERLERKGI